MDVYVGTFTRPRMLVSLCLALLAGLAWAYTIWLAADTDMGNMAASSGGMSGHGMGGVVWSPAYAGFVFFMWAVMMAGMMIPSAAPMVLLFHRVSSGRNATGNPAVATFVFLGGYLALWSAFSAIATLAQWGLYTGALISPMMVGTSHTLGGGMLIAAGVYQWSPWIDTCLAKCRSPLSFLLTQWREGPGGALFMGLRHGAFCVGCCWALMALLFVGGVMNLLWVAGLTVYVLLEKMVPGGPRFGRITGLGLLLWGAWMVLSIMR